MRSSEYQANLIPSFCQRLQELFPLVNREFTSSFKGRLLQSQNDKVCSALSSGKYSGRCTSVPSDSFYVERICKLGLIYRESSSVFPFFFPAQPSSNTYHLCFYLFFPSIATLNRQFWLIQRLVNCVSSQIGNSYDFLTR